MSGVHRPGGLRQSNKSFKSKHATKGSIKAKGKVQHEQRRGPKHFIQNKANRRNAAKLLQQSKRQELQHLQRSIGGTKGAAKLVAVVSLCSDIDANDVLKGFLEHKEVKVLSQPANKNSPATVMIEKWKQKWTMFSVPRDVFEVLEAGKVADFIIFCLSPNVEVDETGQLFITSLMAQGLPSPVSVVVGIHDIPQKHQAPIMKSLTSYAAQFFPKDNHIYPCDTESDIDAVMRHIAHKTPKFVSWRNEHSYMLIENAQFVADPEYEGNQLLKITGYCRGKNWDPNRLVYLREFGDFLVRRVEIAEEPQLSHTKQRRPTDAMDVDAGNSSSDGQFVRLSAMTPNEFQDDLEDENAVDTFANEQTWPTDEEMAQASDERALRKLALGKKRKMRVPKGTSSYQAAWIVESDDEFSEDDMEADDSDHDDDMDEDGDFRAPEARDISDTGSDNGQELDEFDVMDSNTIADDDLNPDDDEEEQLRKYLAERSQMSRDDFEFPDEVDTPFDSACRKRFAKYRGLKSFRSSPWDPYEALPQEYAKIFDFEDFNRTRSRVLKSNEGLNAYSYVNVYIANVPFQWMAMYEKLPVSSAFTLMEYEHKTSVLHYTCSRVDTYEEPVKSKDPMIICSGFRRLMANPIFSQHTKGNKHKYERFLQSGTPAVATIYGPIQFPSCPALFFKDNGPGTVPTLVATGSLFEVKPERVIVKRIMLTGDPFKIHKKVVTVRYMFFNPEDVLWFKPVQLRTKSGRTGHIRESLGTHGYMKCQFDGPVRSDDVICMALYKRAFPKWKSQIHRLEL